jgi:hypothetical protein
MFADFPIPNAFGTTLSKIILRVHGKAQPQQSSTAENWLTGPEKNTGSADRIGPAFSRDEQNTRLASLVKQKFAKSCGFRQNSALAALVRARKAKVPGGTSECRTDGDNRPGDLSHTKCLDVPAIS